MPTTANTINYYVAADGTLRDGPQGSISQQPRINYGTDYAVTLSFPAGTLQEGDQLQVALNRTRTFFSSASATGDAPVAAVVKHDVTAEEAAAQTVEVVLSTNTRAMIDQVNGIDHPVRGFFGVHVLRGQSFVTLAVADALMMSLESGPDAISPSLPVVDYPTRQEAEALTERAESAAERAEEAAAGIVPPLQLSAPPTTSTVGSVGQLAVWHDAVNNKDHLYHLCYITEGESATLYHWEECVLVSQGNMAGGYPILDANGKVASAQLPVSNGYSQGIVYGHPSFGVNVSSGRLQTVSANNNEINAKSQSYNPIVPNNLDYAVRSVSPNITEIPAATSDYSLVDSSATTLNHSHTFSHVPTQAPTYRLPSVSDTTVSHYIELTVDFTNVQTYSFLDNAGEPIVPLFTPSIAVGDVYTFRMEYSTIKAAWLIYPQKQGAVADDFVMRGEVGAANGVAGLDANAKVPSGQLPTAGVNILGAVKAYQYYNPAIASGIYANNGLLVIARANNSDINDRTNQYRPIVPLNLNYAVTAAITDSNHITLTDAQKATAQEIFGVGGPITAIPAATSAYMLADGIFTHAPTSAPTYTLPNITDDIRTHEVVLIIDFSSVQTFSFLVDGGGDVTFQSYANPTTGDVWAFRCWWYGGKWRIAPTKIKNCVTRQLTGGSLAITDAVGGDALALRMTAPRSVVVNQLVKPKASGTYSYNGVTYTWADNIITVSGTASATTGSSVVDAEGPETRWVPFFYPRYQHVHMFYAPSIPSAVWRLQSTQNGLKYLNMTNAAVGHKFTYGVYADSEHLFSVFFKTTEGVTYSGSGPIMLVDLTQYFNGDQTLIDSIQTWADLVAYDPRFAQYVEYNAGEVKGVVPAVSVNNGTAIASPDELFAFGTAADEFEAVSGTTTRRMGVVDLGTLTWTDAVVNTTYRYAMTQTGSIIPNAVQGGHAVSAPYTDKGNRSADKNLHFILLGTPDIHIRLYDSAFEGKTGAQIKAALSGVLLYYQLATPTTSTSTPTQISIQAGTNVVTQTDGGRLAPIDITYESDEL